MVTTVTVTVWHQKKCSQGVVHFVSRLIDFYLMLRIEFVHLLPGILKSDGAVLELLTYDLDVLVVLLAVCPVLLVLHTVAACALQLLHVLAVDGVLELH